jgi:hypothetical protein
MLYPIYKYSLQPRQHELFQKTLDYIKACRQHKGMHAVIKQTYHELEPYNFKKIGLLAKIINILWL